LNLSELVEKMPPTDKELEALKPPPGGQAAPPSQRPKAGQPAASKFTAPDPDVVEPICRRVLENGRPALEELIAMIRDPASPDFTNYKAEYLCHCLTLFVGRADQRSSRSLYIGTLVNQAGRSQLPLHTRLFLVRELQLIGDRTCVPALAALLQDEGLCDVAAAALLAIQDGVVEAFRQALPAAQGRCRLVNLQSLAVLADKTSVPEFEKAMADPDLDLRLAAAWALARLPYARASADLLKQAGTAENWERIKLTQACLLMAEKLAASGQKSEARTIYTHLRDTRSDPKEAYIRQAASKALELMGAALAVNP
jgi:HEAT repeat protein